DFRQSLPPSLAALGRRRSLHDGRAYFGANQAAEDAGSFSEEQPRDSLQPDAGDEGISARCDAAVFAGALAGELFDRARRTAEVLELRGRRHGTRELDSSHTAVLCLQQSERPAEPVVDLGASRKSRSTGIGDSSCHYRGTTRTA